MKKEEVFCENCAFFEASPYQTLEVCLSPENLGPKRKAANYYRTGKRLINNKFLPKELNKNTNCSFYKEKPKKKKNWWSYLTSKDGWSCY